ncbi:hypothetical protein RCC89_01755 [Cytophagaceae bacterium ABcell3]|nr:hypothetical protein RCC89_01755 [Cytophagaceae bacterium ABcell3]
MENRMIFRRTRNSGEIISDAFSFIVKNFASMYKVLLFVAGPFYLASMVATGILKAEFGQISPGFDSGVTMAHNSGLFSITLLLGAVGGFFYFSGVYQYIASFMENDGEVTVRDTWSRVKKNAWLFVKTFIGLIFVLFAMFFVFAIAGGIVVAMTAALASIAGFWSVFIGMLAIYFLLFCLVMPLSLVFNVRMYEKSRFFASVQKAYQLASTNWKKSFIVVLIFIGLQFVFGVISSAPDLLAMFGQMGGLLNEYGRAVRIIASFVSGILGFIQGAITLVAINFLYFSLSEERDATGLMDRISDIGKTEEETSL